MKILITNHELAHRRGTESFARDLAGALVREGHTVYIYSPVLGSVAEECGAIGAVVVDDLSKLAAVPDVIHGHHYRPVIAAALRFPSVPIVYLCHGVFPPQELPIRLPAIRKYVGVSNLTRARISEATGIHLERIEIIPNFVDLTKFKHQRVLPDSPKKILLFGNYWKIDSDEYHAIAAACGRYGKLSIDIRGESERNVIKPELELANYDVVFAVGRSAIEAMASGSAVILADLHGIGGMVTPSNFDSLRSMNFALEATRKNLLTADAVYKTLLMYDRAQTEIVTSRVRSELNLDLAVLRWKQIYQDAISCQNSKTHLGGRQFALLATHAAVFVNKWRTRDSNLAFAAGIILYVLRKIDFISR